MTADQGAALFAAPELPGQGALFGELYEPAGAAPRITECGTCHGRLIACECAGKTCAGIQHAANRSHWCPRGALSRAEL